MDFFCSQFISAYNSRQLPAMFYSGIPADIRDSALRTQHKWNLKMTSADLEKAAVVADEVDIKTRIKIGDAWTLKKPGIVSSSYNAAPNQQLSVFEVDEKRDKERKIKHDEKKGIRENAAVVLDELAPRPTGRDALFDKRKGDAYNQHAAAREREENRDGLNMPEQEVMGGGDDFMSVRERIERGKRIRESKKQERLHEIQEREDKKQANFLSNLGIDLSKGPITIAPRG